MKAQNPEYGKKPYDSGTAYRRKRYEHRNKAVPHSADYVCKAVHYAAHKINCADDFKPCHAGIYYSRIFRIDS